MNKKLLAAGALVVIAGVVAAFSFMSSPGYTPPQAFAAPTSLAASAAYGNDSMVFANGRSFVEYNYKTGKTKLLSPNALYPGLDNIDSLSVSSDKQHLLFHSSYATMGGVLSNTLLDHGLDPTAASWWLYSLSDQTFTLLPQEVVAAHMDGDKLYTLANKDGASTIAARDLANLQQTTNVSVPDSSNFLVANGTFLLQTPDKAILSTKDGKVSTQVAQPLTLLGVTADKQHVVGLRETKDARELAAIELSTSKESTLAKDVLGTPALLGSGTVFYTSGDKKQSGARDFHTYNFATQKTERWNMPDGVNNNTFTSSAVLSDKIVVTAADDGTCYIAGEGLKTIKAPDSHYEQIFTMGDGQVDLHYSSDNHAFIADLDTNASSEEQDAVYNRLRRDGYDPYLFTVR